MTFQEDFRKSSSRARRGGGGSRGGIAIGGGLGSLVLVGLFLLLGGNPAQIGDLLGDGNSQTSQGNQQSRGNLGGDESGDLSHCQTGADANAHDDCRIEFTGISLDRVWAEQLPQQAGVEYTQPDIVIFSGSVQSGCGRASAQTGPFYCPADETTYFDTSFFHTLVQLGGSDGAFAQQYVVAHEFGHHIQKLENTLGLSDYQDPGPDSNAVKIELQADCYAGVWAHFADKGEDAILQPLTQEQVRQAIETAQSIGDDTIQQHSGGSIQPDLWTHGSAEQRRQAFTTGYESGSMARCDYLDRGVYR